MRYCTFSIVLLYFSRKETIPWHSIRNINIYQIKGYILKLKIHVNYTIAVEIHILNPYCHRLELINKPEMKTPPWIKLVRNLMKISTMKIKSHKPSNENQISLQDD